jgi:dolichol-phosphate mannosyltransferase
MSFADRTLINIATYNEIENLPGLVEEIFRYAPDAHLLIVDDNSPDGTGQWVDEQAKQDERVHCLHRSGKLGLGTAIMAGMKCAIEHDYRYFLNMDADYSHHPKYLPQLIAAMEPTGGKPVDLVIGSRYVPGGGVENWPLKRLLMSKSVNAYARWLLWLKPHDCSGGYRCYRTSMLKKLDFEAYHSRGYSFQQETLWRMKQAGANFAEVPILFADRVKGNSKINMREARRAIKIIARLAVTNWTGL